MHCNVMIHKNSHLFVINSIWMNRRLKNRTEQMEKNSIEREREEKRERERERREEREHPASPMGVNTGVVIVVAVGVKIIE